MPPLPFKNQWVYWVTESTEHKKPNNSMNRTNPMQAPAVSDLVYFRQKSFDVGLFWPHDVGYRVSAAALPCFGQRLKLLLTL
jgi:hypothetical protein